MMLVQATTYRIENLAGVYYAMFEVWTRLSVAYLLLVQSLCSQSLTHVLIVSVCAMTFRCCARNLAFNRIQVVWVCNLNKTCSGPTRSTKGWSRCALGRGVRHSSLEFLWVHSVTKVENLCRKPCKIGTQCSYYGTLRGLRILSLCVLFEKKIGLYRLKIYPRKRPQSPKIERRIERQKLYKFSFN